MSDTSAPAQSAQDLAFLSGGGEMGAMVRSHDWTTTPLGAPETWPQSLRSIVSACLNSPMLGAVLWGPDLIMLYNDAYMLSMADRHPGALGRPVAEVWGAAWEQVSSPFHRVLETGEGFAMASVALPVLRRGRQETTYWDFTAAPIRGEGGTIVGLLNQGVEITERMLAQSALKAERDRLASVLGERDEAASVLRAFAAAMPGVVYAKDREGRMLVANSGTTELIGKQPEFYIGKTDMEFLEDKEQAAAVMATDQRIMRSEQPEQVEELVDYPDGSRVVWLSNKAPFKDADGQVIGLIGSSVDITDRKSAEAALSDLNRTLEHRIEAAVAELRQTEEALRQSQKMEAVGQLTGGIAHDFNNMLAVVIGSLDLLSRRAGAVDPRARRYVDAAMEAARRAALLTQRLLAFSRQQPLHPKPIETNKLVAGMSDLLRHSLGATVQLETVLAGGLWRSFADPNQLENVILNLAVNARDAMPEGGWLTIETQNTHLDSRYVAAHLGVPAGHYVLVAVTDSGCGMPQEVIAKAFDPFFTTKEVGKGTGLGLSQVYGFVKQSGGHVKIYSEPGQGTTVKVYLPRYLGGPGEPAEEVDEPEIPLGESQEVVLVVEDEPSVRQFSVDALTELGYRVLEADGAVAALQLLEVHPNIALMFTDVVMPGLNGAKLAREARRIRPDLKVLFTTGYTRNAVVHNGVLDPGVELIGKPFTIEELAARVRAVLDAPANDGRSQP